MEFKKRNVKIFILSGKAGSGKDTVSKLLKSQLEKKSYKAVSISYAFYLKNYAKQILSWDGSNDTKPRSFLQELGISLIKEKIDNNFLINRVLEDIKIYSYFYDTIIITDARLKEEIEIIKDNYKDVFVIHIIGSDNNLTEKEKNHITEISLDNYNNYDFEINNIDINNTKEIVKEIVGGIYE